MAWTALSWTVGAVLASIGVIRIAQALPSRSHANDFAHYYVTSRVWVEGHDPYSASFSAEFAKYGFQYDPRIPSAGNAPPLVAAFAPIARLPVETAFDVWVAIEIGTLIASLAMIWWVLRTRLPRVLLPILMGSLIASSALYFHFYYSQVQLLVGLLLLAAYLSQRSQRYARALLLASAAALLKLFPATILPWLLVSAPGSWRRKALRTLPAAALIAATVLLTWTLWPRFLAAGSWVITDYVPMQGFNYSLPSLVVNLGWASYGLTPTPAEIARLWRLAYAAGGLLVAAAYVLCRGRDPERAFCLQLVATTFASPIAWGHYLVLLFFPFSVFCADVIARPSAVRIVAMSLGYAFILNLGNASGIAAPLSVRIVASYLPLYASLALGAWLAVDEPQRIQTAAR